jgi:predicted phage tail protein
MARRKIHLHGALKKLCPEGIELEAETVLEAVNGMCKLLRLKPHPITGRSLVKVVGFETVESLSEKSEQRDLHIVPAFLGGKNWVGVVKIVVGAVLIAAAFVVGVASPWGLLLLNMGVGLVVGGLINILFPTKQADTGFSNYLGAPGNTTRIGTRIPLMFGKNVKHYGHILSYNIDAVAT